jgi:hypothetical protein
MGRYSASLIKRGAYATAMTAFTSGAAPKSINGKTVLMEYVETGSLAAHVSVNARTSTTTIAAVWEVSDDNSTFIPCRLTNNPASVVLVTGSGSDVALECTIDAPSAVYAKLYARLRLVTGTGTADGTNDKGAIKYYYREVE